MILEVMAHYRSAKVLKLTIFFTASYRTFVLFIFATVSHLDEILYASSTPFSLLSFPCCLAMISLLIFNRSWIDFLSVCTVFDFSFPTRLSSESINSILQFVYIKFLIFIEVFGSLNS